MNRLKSNHQDLELNTIIYWQPMKVVKYNWRAPERTKRDRNGFIQYFESLALTCGRQSLTGLPMKR